MFRAQKINSKTFTAFPIKISGAHFVAWQRLQLKIINNHLNRRKFIKSEAVSAREIISLIVVFHRLNDPLKLYHRETQMSSFYSFMRLSGEDC